MHEGSGNFDVVIIGAGAAGLAAAALLSARSELTIGVLEARDRLGGRIATRHSPLLPVPLELGAEFIHGRPPTTIDWLRRGNATIIDAATQRWTRDANELRPADDLFDDLKRGLAKAGRPRKDIPFAEFLEGPARRKLSPRVREFARMLLEGFDAADATRASTYETVEEWCGNGAADAPTFRPQHGYSALIRALHGALDPAKVDVQLNTVVREVEWERGAVRLDAKQQGRPIKVTAERAIVTLPLGVLKQPPFAPAAVRFAPALKAKTDALAALASGPVIKVILKFRSAFWEELDDARYCDAAFFHSPDAPFPTFWTALPSRAPVLSAWAAGPNATALSSLGESQIVRSALDSVQSAFGAGVDVHAQFQGAYLHDWQADPFACGAYSYVLAGGARAREQLAKPLSGTLFFAGEAADIGGESGTVAGALQSGEQAATQLLAARARATSRGRA